MFDLYENTRNIKFEMTQLKKQEKEKKRAEDIKFTT